MSQHALHRILITGKHGQVGRELVDRAEELGIDAVAFGSKELDIRDRAAVFEALLKHQPTAVINAAAYTAVDKAEQEKESAYAVNRDGVENLALACKVQDTPLIHISTDYVFDGEKKEPYVETDTPNPTSIYGSSKLAGEIALQNIWYKHIILRVSWVFGEHGNNFVKTMLRLAKDRDELGVVGDQFGAPTYAADIAAALITMAESTVNTFNERHFGTYHFSGAPHVSWSQFAEVIFDKASEQKILACPPKINTITTSDYPTPAKRPANSKLDVGLVTKDFGIEASDWQKALDNIKVYITK